jgi:hypothetical protein
MRERSDRPSSAKFQANEVLALPAATVLETGVEMTSTDKEARSPARELGRWLWQGVRSGLLLHPDWRGLRATPGLLLLFIVVDYAAAIAAQRLYIVGDATFYWRVFGYGMLSTAILAWCCWFVMPPATEYRDLRRHPVDAPTLFSMFILQSLALGLIFALVYVPALHLGLSLENPHRWFQWVGALLPVSWLAVAQLRLMARSRDGHRLRRLSAAVIVVLGLAINVFVFPQQFWYANRPQPAPDAAEDKPLELTQEMMEREPQILAAALDALKPQRKGIIDVYAITFAPYASQDVFMRESALVAGVMQQRFDAAGRTIELVNNKATVEQRPWATPLNLQRAIARVAQRMDKDEDVLFIHLTSHGGGDGHLAADFDPMTVSSVTPQALRQWLDDAGIRHRVISISACFSGSWVAPLASPDTLVMTAADAQHTSYGCGSKSELTFFGRAMYDEALRKTWSFEQAFATARKVIQQREIEAGKDDGFSNPQIRVGPVIARKLVALQAQLAASSAR